MKKVTTIILALVLAFSFSAFPASAAEEAPAEIDLTPSEGLEFESNGDGTCSIVGIGTCTDTDLVIPTQSPAGDTVTLIAPRAFEYLEDVDSVTLAGYEHEVGERAFQYGEFETLSIVGGAPVLDEAAFSSCEDLTSITIQDSDITSGEDVFYSCGDEAEVSFINCTGLLDDGQFKYADIISLSFNSCELEFGEYLVSSCDGLASVVFTDSNIMMNENAFYSFGDKATVEMTGCTMALDKRAFEYSEIVSLTVTDTDIELEEYDFSSCEDLTSIKFVNSVISADENAFYSCGDEAEVEITDCQTELDKRVFEYSSLKSLTVTGGSFSAEEYAFGSCEDLENVQIDCNQVTLHENAFNSCDDLVSVSICNSDEADHEIVIDDGAFEYCEKLAEVTIGDGLTELGKYVFDGCAEDLIITIAGTQYTADQLSDGLD